MLMVYDERQQPSTPFLGDAWGEDQYLLQHLLVDAAVEHPMSSILLVGISEPEDAGATGDHGVEKIGAADATEGASPALWTC